MFTFFVYILREPDGSILTGRTNDLQKAMEVCSAYQSAGVLSSSARAYIEIYKEPLDAIQRSRELRKKQKATQIFPIVLPISNIQLTV